MQTRDLFNQFSLCLYFKKVACGMLSLQYASLHSQENDIVKQGCRPAMSTANGLLNQKVCHYLDQGHTLNDILLRTARCMTCFDLNSLNLF